MACFRMAYIRRNAAQYTSQSNPYGLAALFDHDHHDDSSDPPPGSPAKWNQC